MKVIIKNTGYFFKEISTIMKLDFVSNLFSIFSLAFIFFLLSLIIAGGWTTNNMITAIEKEAEISVYYLEEADVVALSKRIGNLDGVLKANVINALEAKSRMTEIMGEESRILELFDHNPFSPYVEVKIDLDDMDTVAGEVQLLEGVDFVRDNKEVLKNLKGISNLANILGYLVIVAVSVATLVITSHIIRQGIYLNRESINTLRLLGAPEVFITLPFILEGLVMSVLAGLLSIGMVALVIVYVNSEIAGYLPFMVLPDLKEMLIGISVFSLVLSLILGLLGSLFGLRSTKSKH